MIPWVSTGFTHAGSPGGKLSGTNAAQIWQCPKCGRKYESPVELISYGHKCGTPLTFKAMKLVSTVSQKIVEEDE